MKAIGWGILALLILIFGLLTAGLAQAQQPAGEAMKCAPLSEALPDLVQSAERIGAVSMPLTGAEAKAFLRVVNAEEPRTDFDAEAILIIAPPQGMALIFLIHKSRNEICGYIIVNDEVASRAMLASKAMRGPKA